MGLLFISLSVYKCLAIIGSIFFVLQLVVSLTGICPFKVDPIVKGDFAVTRHRAKILMGRSFIGFVFGFGWIGVFLFNKLDDGLMIDILSFLAALVIAILLYPVLKFICRMGEKSVFEAGDAVERVAEVFISIPAKGEGTGKVMIVVKGSFLEYEAISFETKTIEKGKIVTIVGVDESVLIVSPI